MVQLGYLGLILLVYAGGLSTSFRALKANLLLSSAVALTGIAVPIALSYSLQGLLGATPLQAFAAGAALCSTSLGTTFTVLASSGLSPTRLGIVLTSAAMMDDVVGLIMVQVISNLGGDSISAITVVRPVLVSVAFAVIVPLACRFLVKPITMVLNQYRKTHRDARISKLLSLRSAAFTFHTSLLVALVAGASYAGTSNLFAAYIAGAAISWWDSEVPHPNTHLETAQESAVQEKTRETGPASDGNATSEAAATGEDEVDARRNSRQGSAVQRKPTEHSEEPLLVEDVTSGSAIYERYYQQAVTRILQPFFFASIGFSIPTTRMFTGSIVWRGIVYTILMSFGKLVCGLWLVRFSTPPVRDAFRKMPSKMKLPSAPHLWGKSKNRRRPAENNAGESIPQDSQPSNAAHAVSHSHTASVPRPFSLHPPLILALAMTARGEIGFLISAVAESRGVFSQSSQTPGSESDIFLIVTWAIVLCTIIGPLGVGLSVRRVKVLEARKNGEHEGAGRDVLGVWGVE